jgi:hypothetical protein
MKKFSVLVVFAVTLAAASLSPGRAGLVWAQGSGDRGGPKLDFDVGDEDPLTPADPAEQAKREQERARERADREAAQQAVLIAAAAGGLVGLCLTLLVLACYWIIFRKAGKPGWASLIPIYNVIVLLEICGRPLWWFLLLLVPCVNLVVGVIVVIDLAKSFGKGIGFAIGLMLFGIIFLPILAFGSARYRGPAAAG